MKVNVPRALPGCILLAASLVGIAGCGQRDPYLRTDVWRPTGANAANIAAMAANPRDLIAGHGDTRSDTKASTLAVERLWSGQQPPLSGGTSGDAGNGQSAGGGQAPGGSGAGAAPGAAGP